MLGGHEYLSINKEDIDTPALLIDLDLLEKNIETVAKFYRGKKGAALLPHQKGIRSPIIARKQMAAGAKGVSITSFSLAELYVNFGIKNILITNEIYGKNKITRLANYSKHGDLTVAVDNMKNVKQLSKAALSNKSKINIAIELYMGLGSAGIKNWEKEALPFVKEITKLKGVHFKGMWWHQGNLGAIANWEERKIAHFETLDKVARLKAEIEDAGVDVEMLSGGYTCTWNITPLYTGLSEVGVQAGNYVFSDWVDKLLEGNEQLECALTVLTRCTSRPSANEAIFDFGLNSCSGEAGGQGGDEIKGGYSSIVGPKFKDLEGVEYPVHQREEISWITFKHPSREINVGEVFEMIPPHADTTAKLHDKYYCIRDNKLEVIWPNYGRGLF
jgi:D-serine deaminase-like pyridoxal phosphate-dependent protein